MKTTTAAAPVLTIPLTSGGTLTIPNPPATEAMRDELDRLERLADARAREQEKRAAAAA